MRRANYLATARAIHAPMAAAWRPEKDGGILWCLEPDKQKANAITNSLFIILSARLAQRTRESAYLDGAKRALEWQHAKKLYDGTGIVDVPGHVGDYWSYNQGAYIGGLTALYQATGGVKYLAEAATVATTVLTRAGLTTANSVLGEKLGVTGDASLFKGICARYIGQLRDLLKTRQLHPETAALIDRTLLAIATSPLRIGPGPDGQFPVEWHDGAKDTTTHNFNAHTSALALLLTQLAAPRP